MMSGKYQNNSKAGKTMIKESHKIVRKFPIISQFVPHNENKILTFKTSCHGIQILEKIRYDYFKLKNYQNIEICKYRNIQYIMRL